MNTHVVVFSGAGISAESGLRTFRDSDGLWEEYDIYEVATPEAWARDPELVLRFYNERRKQMRSVNPNAAHTAIAELERHTQVTVITQNIDDLHERAGSSSVLHLHGEIRKARSTQKDTLLYDLGERDIAWGDTCELGSQLRPHVVWFGEAVPAMAEAAQVIRGADILLVVGTSLQVYPAAGLLHEAPPSCKAYYVDPKAESIPTSYPLEVIKEKASSGVPKLASLLQEKML